MEKPFWVKVAAWQDGFPILASTAIQGPGNRRAIVLETIAQNGVAVVEKVGDDKKGRFVGLQIHEKPFKTVVASIKRSFTRERNKQEKEGQLC